ncbi:MAG: O-antigen ligase family protein [Candidatus Omnitrophota bacterium]
MMFIKVLKPVFIVILLCWISLFPEPVHECCSVCTQVILGCFFLIFLFARKDKRALFSLRDIPLWLFLLAFSGGIMSAQNKAVAVQAYLDVSLTLFFLYYLCKEVFNSDRNLEFLARAVCLFSIFVSAAAILEWALGRNPIYEYLVKNPYYYRYMHGPYRRPMSTQFNPVILGTYLLACIPFVLVLAKFGLKDKQRSPRYLGMFSIVLSLPVIALTSSRGVLLGTAALMLFYLWHVGKKRITALFILSLVLFMGVCSWPGAGRINRFGVQQMICGSYDSIFSEYRFTRVRMAAEMLKDYPLTGIGLKHFRIRFNEYYPHQEPEINEFMVADNMYLTILAETGITGGAGLFIFIGWLLWRGQKCFSGIKEKKKKLFLLAVLSGFIGLLVNMAAYELFYWHVPLIFFSLYCGLIASRMAVSEVWERRQ